MQIRELKSNELDDLLELYSYLHHDDDPLPERSTVEIVWREILNSPNYQLYGVFVDNVLVASCALSITPNLTRGCRPYGVIENVVTHMDHRRKGYGASVLRFALEQAWKSNCYKVMLLTGRKSEAVYQFYENAGFDRDAKRAFLAKPTQKS